MKSTKLFFVLIIIAIISISSCSELSGQSTEIADFIEISYQTGPEIEVNQDLTVWLKNNSKYCISFPVDFGLKVFVEKDNGWFEIQNLGTFLGDQPILLKPKGDIFSENVIDVRPDVSNLSLNKSTNFYALLSGHLCEDETKVVEKKIEFVIVP